LEFVDVESGLKLVRNEKKGQMVLTFISNVVTEAA